MNIDACVSHIHREASASSIDLLDHFQPCHLIRRTLRYISSICQVCTYISGA